MNTKKVSRRKAFRVGMYDRLVVENGGILGRDHGVPIYRAEKRREIAA
jgi:hypothetical protein